MEAKYKRLCHWDPAKADTSIDPETGRPGNPFAPVLTGLAEIEPLKDRLEAFDALLDDILKQSERRMKAIVRKEKIRPVDLGELLGLSASSATRILNGERAMNASAIAVFCRKYAEMSCDEFMLGIKEPRIVIPRELNTRLDLCVRLRGKKAETLIANLLKSKYEPILAEARQPYELSQQETLERFSAAYKGLESWNVICRNGDWVKPFYKVMYVRNEELKIEPMRARRLVLNRIRFNLPADYFNLRDFTETCMVYTNLNGVIEKASDVMKAAARCYLLLDAERRTEFLADLVLCVAG